MKQRGSSNGFTLLEVMIAIGILGILMLAVSQMMCLEIGIFNVENKQNEIEEKARIVMNYVLDQIRLNGYVYYYPGDGYNAGIYSNDPDTGVRCLLNINPDPGGGASSSEMFYDPDRDELWYRDTFTENTYLIADNISVLDIQAVTPHLARIRVVAAKPATDIAFELVTWARLY